MSTTKPASSEMHPGPGFRVRKNIPRSDNEALIDRYREFLPVSDTTPIVSLQEGETPLLRAKNLERYLEEKPIPPLDLAGAVSKAIAVGTLIPVLCASAKRDIGVSEFIGQKPLTCLECLECEAPNMLE